MKVSIIGSSGFIGNNLFNSLKNNNYQVISVSLRNENIEKLSKKKIESIFSSDVIINCAASLFPKTIEDENFNKFLIKKLIEINYEYNKKILHLSSINVLIKDRLDSYTQTKRFAENLVKNSKNLIILRLPLVVEKVNNHYINSGNLKKIFDLIDKPYMFIVPVISPGHLYQPIDIKVLCKEIEKIINKDSGQKYYNLVGNDQIYLSNIIKEIAENKKKYTFKINVKLIYKFLPEFIKEMIKKQNNIVQQIASIDHTNFNQ